MNRHPLNFICSLLFVILVVVSLLTAVPDRITAAESGDGYTNEDCIECHQAGSAESDLHISIEDFESSVHGQEITCLDCHTGVVDDEHQNIEGSGAVDCNECHEQENQHGTQGPAEKRPQCHDCHTRHNMLSKDDPASAVHRDQLPVTCAGCHPLTSGETSFFSWFPSFQIASHAKGDFATRYDTDNCIGCHQGAAVHGDSQPIDNQNCGKCHLSPEGDGAMWGYTHPQAKIDTQSTVFAAASIYQVFVVIGLIALLGKVLDLVFDHIPGKSKR
jgi:hypothetical protein